MSQDTVFDLLQERRRAVGRVLLSVFAVVLGSAVIAVSARIQFPVPGTVVPFTMQTLAVVVLGMVLGPRLGAAAAALYLAEVLAMPALSASGRIALTGGFIVGFIPSAWLAGTLFARGYGRSAGRALFAMIPAKLVVFAFGVPWLLLSGGAFASDGATATIMFAAIEVAKIAAAMLAMRWISSASTSLKDALQV